MGRDVAGTVVFDPTCMYTTGILTSTCLNCAITCDWYNR